MLTARDIPTIENAIRKRLHFDEKKNRGERGVYVLDVVVKDHGPPDPDPHIAVGVNMTVDTVLSVRSFFELPCEFHISHLHNEIDEIAEGCKAARAAHWGMGRPGSLMMNPATVLAGTGLRGRWKAFA